jgi:hypothetical protein
MGGQACVLYGAAEFSRDTDLAILASAANLARLRLAMDDLQARVIAVPGLQAKYLRRGHAVHFRCQDPEALGMRIDVMTRMRGLEPFPKLWARRTTIELPDGTRCQVMSLPDLVQAKKTQRDKDWPMRRAGARIRRHVDLGCSELVRRIGQLAAIRGEVRPLLVERRLAEWSGLSARLSTDFPRACSGDM